MFIVWCFARLIERGLFFAVRRTRLNFMSEPSTESADSPEPVRAFLKPRKAMPFFGRHPWVFESAIESLATPDGAEPAAGTPVELWTAKKEFVAHGLWNPQSNIRIRLYSWDKQRTVNAQLLEERINRAIEMRRSLFDLASDKTGCRLVFSESDGLSGLIVDSYGGFLIVQFTSLALFQFKEAIVDTLKSVLQPRGVWMRTEKGMREAEGLEAVDGLVDGVEPPRPLFIEENGVQYGVDVQEGQKTGCYLDQRDNRVVAAKYLKDANVLDAFCFSGGFGITALKAGAKHVTCVDSSELALTMAAANAKLNGVADRCEFRRSDARKELESLAEQEQTFDAVILDPPKMARTRGGLQRAMKGYVRFNSLGVNVLKPGGILVTCSCSGHVTRADFSQMIAEVARQTKRDIQILEQHGQPADHPVFATCPETEYLKMLVCRVS